MADEVTNEVNPFSNIKLEAPTDNPFANVKVEKPSKPEDYGPVAAFARGAASGLTFDWADELAAMYQAGIPDYLRGDPEAQKRYEEALAQQRKVSREMKEQYPVTSFAGEVTGAVPSMFVPGMAPARGASLTARVGRGMLTGAGTGLVSGAGAAEEDRLSGALTGTAVGTGLGAAAPLIPSALGGAYNRLISPVVTAFKGLKTPEEIALAKLAWAVDRDQKLIGSGKAQGLTLADWQAAKAAGEPVTLADLGAGNVQALLRSAANLSPEARDALENLAQSRFRSQYERIAGDIENLITGPGDARKTRDALKAVYDRERVPAYQRAFNQPNAQVIWDNTLEQMSQAPVVQTALRGANATARSEAAKMGLAPAPNPFQWDRATNLYTIDPSKGVFPNLQFWNAVKINLDDIGGREGQFWAKKLREHLDAYVPEYKDARVGVAAKYFGERDAITAGLAAARSRIAPYELQKVMKQMKPGERAYFQDGYATGLAQDVLGEKGRNVDLTKQLFGSPQAAQRAQIVFGPQNMAKIEARLHLERIMDGARRALGNSTTARQLIEMGLAGGVTAGLMGGFDPTTVLSGAGAGVLARKAVATEAARGMKKFAGYVDGGVARKVAELLTSNDEAKINQAMQMIAKNAALREGLKAIADRVSMAALQRSDNQGQKPAPRAPNPQDPMSAFTYPERRATGGSVLDPMKKKVRQAPPTWTTTNPVWNALNPYQKAAAMALMEADKGNLQDARNALGAMINRAARSKQDLGSHVSQRIYQPSIEPTQQARLSGILKNPAFQQLTGWAERRAQGYEPDPVNGATHFLAPEKTMLSLQQKNPDKYHNWGPFKNTAGRPGKNWSRYNPETGQYENVVTRDESHAFVAPEGRYSVPYRGTTEGAPATAYDQDAMAKLIADAEKREGMDRLVSDVTRPQNVQSLASDQEARQSLDKAVESATGPSSAQKDQLSKYIQGLMEPQPQAPMPLIQGPPIQATPIAPVTPYDTPRAQGGGVLARFAKKKAEGGEVEGVLEKFKPEPTFLETVAEAGKKGFLSGIKETVQGLPGQGWQYTPEKEEDSYLNQQLAKPISEGWKDPKWWAANMMYGLTQSSPTLGATVAGGALGAMTPVPGGTLAGATLGAGLGSYLQTVAPAYQKARAEGLEHEAAVDRAITESGIATVFGGASAAAPMLKTARGPISQALAQIFGVQPGLSVAQQAVTQKATGKEVDPEELLKTYAIGTATGVGQTGASMATGRLGQAIQERRARPGEPPIEAEVKAPVEVKAEPVATSEPVVPKAEPEPMPVAEVKPEIPVEVPKAVEPQKPPRTLDPLGYYSQAQEAVGTLQPKGTPEQMLAQLKKAGVKDAEIEATGLKTLLEGKKSVTRDEIAQYLEQNKVGLEEVVRKRIKDPGGTFWGSRALHSSVDVRPARYEGLEFYQVFVHRHEVGEIERIGDRWHAYSEDGKSRFFNTMPAARDWLTGLDNTKFSENSLDAGNPTYRETVLHLPTESTRRHSERLGRDVVTYPTDTFRSGHFDEPNIVGHMMTSMTQHEGLPVFTLDQIQSDWGQRLRDGGVRDEVKIAGLKDQISRLEPSEFDHQWLREAGGDVERAYRNAKEQLGVDDPFTQALAQMDRSSYARLNAELRTAEAAAPGNPLVNTTDQWVNTVLRRAIQQAVDSNAEYIAIPSGKTVLSYNPGQEKGMTEFYDKIVPKNLRNILHKIDKETPAAVKTMQVETPTQGLKGEGFTLFPLTPKIKSLVKEQGLPLFADGGSVLDRFKKKDDDDWRSNIDIPGPQDPRRQDEVRASEAPRYEELLPGRTVSALNQNPVFQAIQRFAGRSGADPSQYYISPIDGSVQPVEQKSSLLDRFSPTVREGIDKAMLAANFLGPAVKLPPTPKPGIRAYHGSPHDFPAERLIRTPEGKMEYITGAPDKLPDVPKGAEVIEDFPLGRFRDDKIGSGEGAQAYGHGHYAAEAETVAKNYREMLGKSMVEVGGKKYMPAELSEQLWRQSGKESPDFLKGVMDAVHNMSVTGKVPAAPEDLTSWMGYGPMPQREGYAFAAKQLAEAKATPGGRMYELNIKAAPEQFLDWDAPLGQQSESVLNALSQSHPDVLKKTANNIFQMKDRQGQDRWFTAFDDSLVGRIDGWPTKADAEYALKILNERPQTSQPASDWLRQLGSPQHNAELMRKAGIPGIRYKDASSRGTEGGTSNFVIFDPSLIQILRKYGIAGVVMGGGVMFTQDELQAAGILPGQQP